MPICASCVLLTQIKGLRRGKKDFVVARRHAALCGEFPVNYFDNLTSSYFKTAQDGRKLYYPWGFWGRGYVVSETDERRIRQSLMGYYVVVIMAMIAGYVFYNHIGGLAVAAICIVGYAIWARALVRGLTPSSERLTMTESAAAQAHAFGAGWLWFSEIVVVLLLVISIIMLVAEPAEWITAAAGILVFGLCTVMLGWMLVLKSRQAQH